MDTLIIKELVEHLNPLLNGGMHNKTVFGDNFANFWQKYNLVCLKLNYIAHLPR